MSGDVIQAQYEQLETIAGRFRRQAEECANTHRSIMRSVQALRSGGWEGRGASAFFSEVDGVVTPAMQRLQTALTTGDEVTRQIISLMREAEAEAARPFRGNGAEQNGQSGAAGRSNGNGAASDGAGAAGKDGSGDDGGPEAKAKLNIFEQNYGDKKGKVEPGLGFKYGVNGEIAEVDADKKVTVGGVPMSGQAKAQFATGEAALGVHVGKDGVNAGAYGEAYLGKAGAGAVIGNSNLAYTDNIEVRGPGVSGMLGLYQNNFGAEIGGSLVSVERSVGMNVAGKNVGVSAEAGLKAELGARVGKDGVKVKLPLISLGISFGGAKK